MQTLQKVKQIVNDVRFQDWKFIVGEFTIEKFFIVAEFSATCSVKGTIEPQKSRKWEISQYATDSEIVQTCFKAVMTAMEHEIREHFKFQGEAVFGPHFDVLELVKFSKQQKLDARD